MRLMRRPQRAARNVERAKMASSVSLQQSLSTIHLCKLPRGCAKTHPGKFLVPLAIAAAVLVAGGLAWVFAVGPVEQVSWESKSGGRSTGSSRQLLGIPTTFGLSGTVKKEAGRYTMQLLCEPSRKFQF
jgi:hypothetical protein